MRIRCIQEAESLCQALLPEDLRGASIELAEYLKDSFGNATRIDYGSGHETNFIAILCALFVLGVYRDHDRRALALIVFPRCVMQKYGTTNTRLQYVTQR